MHIVIEVRNDEGDGRQLGIVAGEVCEAQIGRSIDCRTVGDISETDPRDMLAAIDAAFSTAIRRVGVNLGANGRQALRVPLERKAFLDQLLAEVACPERIVGMVGAARHLIEKADILIAAREQPEIVALAEVLLAEHASNAGAFCCQFSNVWRVKLATKDLFKIFVLFNDDHDMVVYR